MTAAKSRTAADERGPVTGGPVLSIFPGVDLFGQAFELEGLCVLRGPDPLWGGDVRRFHPPAGHFWGLIGGPPCQDFSSLRRHGQPTKRPSGHGLEMLGEFRRVVSEAEPEWWMLENVARVPDVRIEGYHWQRLDVDLKWFRDATRLRHVQYGSRSGRMLNIARGASQPAPSRPIDASREKLPGAALAGDRRPFAEVCRLQGLPEGFDLPGFTVEGKTRAVGNGVPIPMGQALARAVLAAYGRGPVTLQLTLDGQAEPVGRCPCGCGRPVTIGKSYFDFACRKRAQRRRDAAAGRERAYP